MRAASAPPPIGEHQRASASRTVAARAGRAAPSCASSAGQAGSRSAAVQIEAAQARAAAGDDQRPDDGPGGPHDEGRWAHRGVAAGRAGLGGQRPGRGQDDEAGTRRGRRGAVEVRARPRRPGRRRPARPRRAQQRRPRACGRAPSPLTTTCCRRRRARAARNRHRAAGRPPARRVASGRRAAAPGLAEVTRKARSVGGSGSSVPSRSAASSRSPAPGDAGPCGQRRPAPAGPGCRPAARPAPISASLSPLEDDAGVAGQADLQRAASPPDRRSAA